MGNFTLVIVVIVLILVTRELWTWFLKLNQLVRQNEEIIRLLTKIAGEPADQNKTGAQKIGESVGKLFSKE